MNRDHRWNEINNYLSGERSVFLIGGGTSLRDFDFSLLDKEFTIAINHTIEHYPKAKCLLFGDKIFLHKTKFDFKSYDGMIFCNETCATSKPIQDLLPRDNIYLFETLRDDPVMNAKKGLYHPTSSGILAISLALQMKAKKIYLLGYDYYKLNGSMHFYPDMDHHMKYPEEKLIRKLIKFDKFEKYKNKIINLNPKSNIDMFQKKELSEVFG